MFRDSHERVRFLVHDHLLLAFDIILYRLLSQGSLPRLLS